jgi:hypothetical protein
VKSSEALKPVALLQFFALFAQATRIETDTLFLSLLFLDSDAFNNPVDFIFEFFDPGIPANWFTECLVQDRSGIDGKNKN